MRVDTLTTEDGEMMIILQNLERRPVEVAVQFSLEGENELTEIFSAETLAGPAGTLTVTLGAQEVRVYRG